MSGVIRPGKGPKPTISRDKRGIYRVTPKQRPKSELQKVIDKDERAMKKKTQDRPKISQDKPVNKSRV